MEAQVLEYWARDDTFRASIARRDGAPEYVFYDGPPSPTAYRTTDIY
ncbi:tRNA synthetases class I family protein [Mycobacterium kansasii 824]|nr:tRNA synthetases class I family protein [Mycobacterium kansasii 824]